ncbi:MAG: glycosyltransferase [Candidatus ainarchaeum sp.]|nr:glycosyltransferase [Candidatus ainarchaeum sp.]
MLPKVSIVTVNWNGECHLRDFFASLEDLDYPESRLERIMVDNGSSDGSVKLVRANFPGVKVLRMGANAGFAGGCNQGIYAAKGDYVLLLNNDMVVDRGIVRRMLGAFRKNPAAGAVGAKVYEWNDENPAYCESDAISSSWTRVDARTAKAFNFTDERPAGPVDYAAGCAMMVKREVIRRLGAFDPAYFAYYEDTDWAARMIRAGYEVAYEPGAMAWHRFMSSSNQVSSDFNARMMARNRLRFALKNFDYAFLPGFLASHALELLGKTAYALAGRENDARFMWEAVAWNALHAAGTIAARRRDVGFMNKKNSYNSNLPLRNARPSRMVRSEFMSVVIIPSISWHFPLHQRIHHFARLFAEAGASVLYVEPELHAPNGFPEKNLEVWYPEIKSNPFQFATDAKHSPPTARQVSALRAFMLKAGLLGVYHRVRKFSEERLHLLGGGEPALRQYMRKFSEYSGSRKKTVVYQTPYLSQFIPLFKKLGYYIVYDMVDEVGEFAESPSYFTSGEGYLLENADLVLATAKPLFERARKFNRNAALVPNGVDYGMFAAARGRLGRPRDMPKPGKPVIGYYGAIWNWFDLDLLEFAARARPRYNFVLIGTLYEPYRKRIERLRNVHYLGEKPYAELPRYLANFDVATILFRESRLTKSVNPVKVFEYLAGGKPVVSTHLPELEGFPGVALAGDREEFVRGLDEALKSKPDLKEIDGFLEDKTWDSRFVAALKASGMQRSELRAVESRLHGGAKAAKWVEAYRAPIGQPIELRVTRPDSYSSHTFKLHDSRPGFVYRIEAELAAQKPGLQVGFSVHPSPGNPFLSQSLSGGVNEVAFDLPCPFPSLSVTLNSYSGRPRGKVEIRRLALLRRSR